MDITIYIVILSIAWSSCVAARRGYIMTFPQRLQVGASETFCMSLYNVTGNIEVNMNITCYGRTDQLATQVFTPGENGCFERTLPDNLSPGTCELSVAGFMDDGDYSFNETQGILVVDDHQITFIQTDKPVYRPGQTVKFRILTVNQDLKPVQVPITNVIIKDPSGIYMKEWSAVQVKSGLASLEFPLYDEPVLGEWLIETHVNNRQTQQEFTIEEYVLPKFQVDLQLPEGLTVATETMKFTVCARYMYGKPVAGSLNATVCLQDTLNSWFCDQVVRPCANINSTIDGCHSFSVDTSELNITSRGYSLLCEPRLNLTASVTESTTGVTVRVEQEGSRVMEERVKLRFVGHTYFKPYFPYYVKLYVTDPAGSPVEGEEIILHIDRLAVRESLITDEYGFTNATILNLTHTIDFFTMKAKTIDTEQNDPKVYTIYPASTLRHVKQWYSPSRSYLSLRSDITQPCRCGEQLTVQAVYSLVDNVEIETVHYQAISQGNILLSRDITDRLQSSFLYTPNIEGAFLSPNGIHTPDSDSDDIDNNEDDDSDETPFVLNRPQGPPGWSHDQAPVPPGKRSSGEPWGAVRRQNAAEQVPLDISSLEDTSTTQLHSAEDISSDPVAEPSLWQFTFDLHITDNVAPKLRLLVYLVASNGEIVADTIDFTVDMCWKNKINLYSEEVRRPGHGIGIVLSAEPGSLCSLAMVDKSVYQHAGNNLLQKADLSRRLEKYDISSDFINDWRYCSDNSNMPVIFAPVGPRSMPGSMPGFKIKVENDRAPPFRGRRSIMQFHSNMYDSLLAFKVAGIVALTDLDLQTRPCLYDEIFGPEVNPGDPRGPIPGPGGHIGAVEPIEEPEDNRPPTNSLRNYFPETWLWDLHEIPPSGSIQLNETLPHTITQWVGSSFCTSDTAGIGVSDILKVTSFQPFFLSVNLPYSVIRGEVVDMTVSVFNYLPHCIVIELILLDTAHLSVLESGDHNNAGFCVCSQKAKSHTFKVKPTSLGNINITVSAFLREHRVSCYKHAIPYGYTHQQSRDTVVRSLLVKAEGIPEEMTQSHYVCPQDSVPLYKKTFELDVPGDTIVPGSLQGRVNVIGDIMGPMLSGLNKLVQLPTGCGEQNMIRMAPNVAVLQYLTATNQLTEAIQAKASNHLLHGYQQLLKYTHEDGSYSAFGKADVTGSTWLSAFVFKTLRQALDYIYIDRKQIQTQTWHFLLGKQGADGCFTEHGKVLSKYMQGGVLGGRGEGSRALTAYVLVAMLESFKMMREHTPPFVALAVRCIEVDNVTDPYILALMSYAMALYKPDSSFTDLLIQRLKDRAYIEDDTMYWKRETTTTKTKHRAPSAEIEMTSYALLAILTRDESTPIGAVLPIVRWLTQQRNMYGGFTSTQDTVVALQALAVFARRVYGAGLDVTVNVANGDGAALNFHVTHDNSLLLQQRVMSRPELPVHVTAKGEGCVMMQMSWNYNTLNTVADTSAFQLTITTPVTMETISNNCRSRTITVCCSYTGPNDTSNMVVIEIRMISGWIPNINALDRLLNSVELGIKRYEMDHRNPDVVNFYFDQLTMDEICFEFSVDLETNVANQQPAMATVVDYYESELRATVFYEMSVCSEDELETLDIGQDDDLYLDNLDLVRETDLTNTIETSNEIYSVGGRLGNQLSDDNTVPAPDAPPAEAVAIETGPACPQCVSTGTVHVLEAICDKQVWTLALKGEQMVFQFLSSDSVSPELKIPVPDLLTDCDTCLDLLQQGGRYLAFVDNLHWDWAGVEANLMRQGTVIVPWSHVLQRVVQRALGHCHG